MKKELILLKNKLIESSELYLIQNKLKQIQYHIILKEKSTTIGMIEYRGYHNNLIVGDIGYYILNPYQGNNYAYKALKILSSYLKLSGINDFLISSRTDNIPSIKTIEKYGAKLEYKFNNINIYKCNTKK